MNKQHIVGILIFTLIVGTSIVIASFFIKIPEQTSVTVSDYDIFTFRSERKCRKKRKKRRPKEEVSVKIDQAVFNVKTEKLSLAFSFQGKNNLEKTAKVALYFFVNDKNGTRHLATEYTEVYTDSSVKEINSYNWLRNLQSHENLYIIPQVIGDYDDFSAYKPNFIESKATAIVLRGLDNF
jgi:hypothetical protein